MFVSSYSTYIDAASTKRVQNDKQESVKKVGDSFSTKIQENSTTQVDTTKSNLPINYISEYKSLNTKQQLDQQTESLNSDKTKFTKVNAQTNAKVAYEDNSKMFSFLQKPKTTLDLMPKVDKKLPEPALKGQESIMKNEMINAYTANENYYRITAA
jgi:predicted ATP-dependent endonuclease of OLD family